MEFLVDFTFGIIGGIISSFIFLYLILYYLRPRLRISQSISCVKHGDETFYLIKIVNTSKYDVFDVRVDFFKVRLIPMSNNKTNKRIAQLELQDNFIPHMNKLSSKDMSAGYAYRVVCKENLQDILKQNEHVILEVKIIARHGLSGLSKVFIQSYRMVDIKNGEFNWGTDTNISVY